MVIANYIHLQLHSIKGSKTLGGQSFGASKDCSYCLVVMPEHNHDQNYHPELEFIGTGISQHTQQFVLWLQNQNIIAHFRIDCARCCCYFLVEERGYGLINHQMASIVMFEGQPTTSCYVDGPQGPAGVNGVVKTLHDYNLGDLSIRPVCRSHSYQFYGPAPAALALGQDLIARLEAIAVTQLTGQGQLRRCYFSYADGALLEVYRSATNKGSLMGRFSCCPQGVMKEKVQDEEEADDESEDLSKGVLEMKLQ